jgi:hypothetical protein
MTSITSASLEGEMTVERAVRQLRGLHDLADTDSIQPTLSEKPGGFLQDTLVAGGGHI